MGADVRDHSRGAADGRIDPPGQAVLSPEGSVQPHPLLGILGGDGVDLSQHPVSDHLFGLLQNGVVGITVRHAEQKIFFLGQGLQLLRLPASEGDGFVADNVEAVGNDVLDNLVVGVVGGGHHYKVQPVLPGALGFLLQHGVVVGIDAAGLHPPFLSGLQIFIPVAGETARLQFGQVVELGPDAVDISDQGAVPAPDHCELQLFHRETS